MSEECLGVQYGGKEGDKARDRKEGMNAIGNVAGWDNRVPNSQ